MSSNKFDKSGGTISGDVTVDSKSGTVNTLGYSGVVIGNNIPTGTDKNAEGILRLYGQNAYSTDFTAPNSTANRYINFPNKDGTVALTDDIIDALKVNRVIQTANTKPGQYKYSITEYDNHSTELPVNAFFHILTIEGQDSRYVTQLALGMTTEQVFYRWCYNDTWGTWRELAFKENMVACPVVYLDANQSVTFRINGFAKIMVGHPYEGDFGEYMVQAGYTTGQSASLATFHASNRVSSISKPTTDTVQITASANIFVQVMCVGASVVTS